MDLGLLEASSNLDLMSLMVFCSTSLESSCTTSFCCWLGLRGGDALGVPARLALDEADDSFLLLGEVTREPSCCFTSVTEVKLEYCTSPSEASLMGDPTLISQLLVLDLRAAESASLDGLEPTLDLRLDASLVGLVEDSHSLVGLGALYRRSVTSWADSEMLDLRLDASVVLDLRPNISLVGLTDSLVSELLEVTVTLLLKRDDTCLVVTSLAGLTESLDELLEMRMDTSLEGLDDTVMRRDETSLADSALVLDRRLDETSLVVSDTLDLRAGLTDSLVSELLDMRLDASLVGLLVRLERRDDVLDLRLDASLATSVVLDLRLETSLGESVVLERRLDTSLAGLADFLPDTSLVGDAFWRLQGLAASNISNAEWLCCTMVVCS